MNNNYGLQTGYADKEKDESTGLVTFPLRQYDPRLGRWLTPDPYHQYFSPYMSVGNNPISFIDPTGGEGEPADASSEGLDPFLQLVQNSYSGLSAQYSNYGEYHEDMMQHLIYGELVGLEEIMERHKQACTGGEVISDEVVEYEFHFKTLSGATIELVDEMLQEEGSNQTMLEKGYGRGGLVWLAKNWTVFSG